MKGWGRIVGYDIYAGKIGDCRITLKKAGSKLNPIYQIEINTEDFSKSFNFLDETSPNHGQIKETFFEVQKKYFAEEKRNEEEKIGKGYEVITKILNKLKK